MANEVQYEVWYDARDGARRHLKANSKADVKQAISDLREDEDRHILLGKTIGVEIPVRDLNVEILKVTTATEKVDL